MVRGRGSFVAEAPPPHDLRAAADGLAAQVAAQARAAGVAPADLIAALARLKGRA
jgi:hypothetical protein